MCLRTGPGCAFSRWSIAVLLILALSPFGHAARGSEDTIVPISNLSPYPPGVDCNIAIQSGTLWRNSETEPYMDVDPGWPDRMAAIVHQDRWSNGSAQSTATFHSDDGGRSWDLSHTPITRCSGGHLVGPESFDRASDPWLAVTPGRVGGDDDDRDDDEDRDDGGDRRGAVFHQMSLMTDRLPPGYTELRSAYSMLRSTDGGKTWSDPIVVSNLTEREPGAPFNDKNSLTADPYAKRFVYATWQLLKDVLPGDDSALPLQFFYSDTYFIRTGDKGKSWEPARAIYRIRNDVELFAKSGIPAGTPLFGAQNIGHQIVVLPDGRLVNISQAIISALGPDFLERVIIRSFDNGDTWEQTATIVPSATVGGFVSFDAELFTASGGAIGNTTRAAGSIPDIAVNRTNGHMYVVWQNVDPGFSFIGVFMTMSRDGGDTWSDEIVVGGGQPTADGSLSFAQLPAVHVADDGTVGVLFFDDRNDVTCPDLNLGNEDNPECFTILPDGSVKAGPFDHDWYFKTFDPDLNPIAEVRITPESFDMRQAPIARGYFPGDYVNCSSADNDFVCAFTVTNNLGLPVRGSPPDAQLAFEADNRQDMVFKRIPGESVCNFEHTLARYRAQRAAAEIDIPRRVDKKRLKFLERRFEAACGDDADRSKPRERNEDD